MKQHEQVLTALLKQYIKINTDMNFSVSDEQFDVLYEKIDIALKCFGVAFPEKPLIKFVIERELKGVFDSEETFLKFCQTK